jgi:hypothetical protein
MPWTLTCDGRTDGRWLGLTHCLTKRDHPAHPASEDPVTDPVPDLSAALRAGGLSDADITALTAALHLAATTAEDHQVARERDALWESTYGEHARAVEATEAGRAWFEQADAWRTLHYRLTH